MKPVDLWITGIAFAVWTAAWLLGYQSWIGATSAVLVPIYLWANRRASR
jgi:hypothetical protein